METSNSWLLNIAFLLFFWFVPLPLFVLNFVRCAQFKKTTCQKRRNTGAEHFIFPQQDEQQSSQISYLGAFDGANSMHFSGQSVNDEEIWIPAESELSPTISPQYETPTFSGKLNFLALKPVKK